MALTEEQLQHYFREGYVVLPGLVPGSSVDAVLRAAPRRHDGTGWRAQIFDRQDPGKDAALHRLLAEPSVIAAVESVFGQPARVYYGMLAVVPAHGGHGLPWHQDNQYTTLVGGGALNAFIALSEITAENAGLWVAPGSHRRGVQPSKANETTAPGHREAIVEPDNGIPLPAMRPGDACLFDRSTYHRSLQNRTGEDRYAYAAQYVADNGRLAETGCQDPTWMLAQELRSRWLTLGLLSPTPPVTPPPPVPSAPEAAAS